MSYEDVLKSFFGDGYHNKIRKLLHRRDVSELVTDEIIDAEANVITTQLQMAALLDHIHDNFLSSIGDRQKKAQEVARLYHAGLLAMYPINSRVKLDKHKEWNRTNWFNKGKKLTDMADRKYKALCEELGVDGYQAKKIKV